MDNIVEPQQGSEASYETIKHRCVQCLVSFDTLGLTELKLELPMGLGIFKSMSGGDDVVRVGLFPEDRRSVIILEPMYFCIKSYRSTGKVIYLEQVLTKPCVTSFNSSDDYIYDIDPQYLAAIRKLISNSDQITSNLAALAERATTFYYMQCFNIQGL